MKKLLVIIFLFISLVIQAQKTYFVAATGGNNGNNGAIGTPWATLAFAVTQAVSGDVIYMQAGTHTINTRVSVPVGVSLTGAGETSIITTDGIATEWAMLIQLESVTVTDGNQSISYLKFDGNSLAVDVALRISGRNNVKVHHCTFIDFHYVGVYWMSATSGDDYTPPVDYVTGNEFYNNTMTNCAHYGAWALGALTIKGQVGMLIHDNNISQTGRAAGTNGWPIAVWSWAKGLKIYNNTLFKDDVSNWDFCLEMNRIFGLEMYNNTITGSIDINFIEKGAYDYGAYFHNNILGPKTPSSVGYTGIILEYGTSDVIIKYNKFRNLETGIHYTPRPGSIITNHEISYNIFEGLGRGHAGWGAIRLWEDPDKFVLGNYNVYNNVFYGDPDMMIYGIGIGGYSSGGVINIINNIFINAAWYYALNLSTLNNLTTLNIKSNIFYNNGNSNGYQLAGTPKSYVNTGNIIKNPDFYSEINFHPNSGSSAIDAGIYIPGLKYDLDEILLEEGKSPNIGCYETIAELTSPSYVSSVIDDSNPSLLIIIYDMALIQIIPDISFFEIKSNSQVVPISSVTIVDGKVHISLESPVFWGDKVTLLYRIPSEKPLQSVTNIIAAGIPNLDVTNNVKSHGNGNSFFLILNIYPNPISDSFIINIEGEIPETASIFRIYSLSGVVVFEQTFNLSLLNHRIYVNLNSGLYIANLLTDSSILCASKFLVVK